MVTAVNEAPSAASVPFLTDAQVEAMSQEEILAYFERLRAVATAKGVTLPSTRAVSSGGGVTIDQVLSRAGIFTRAQHAFERAEARRDTTKGNYETSLAEYLKANNLTELPEATQNQINEHVAAARANAQSGYEKVAATNKGKRKKGSVETHLEAVNAAEGAPTVTPEEGANTEG